MAKHAVMIAGGGPTGMMLAAELALAKVDVAIVERRPNHVLVGSRAGGFHSRTIEVLDQRGVADRFLAEGQVAQAAMIGTTVLDMSDFRRVIRIRSGSGRTRLSGSWPPGSPSCRCGSTTDVR
jgi:2-polyprenyl-6-methoxyphenol hydroxylase-like FAD-dependent oxidoreductase